ncbi:MAG: DNA polymerase III subunit alpha [Erysipelotrichaceae bacterium]|nr:DNA polymerase III subunit alpha [Erysipelotrichaceae bacterium]
MASPMYVKTVYSLLSSMNSIDAVLKCAEKYHYSSVAIVDKNVLSASMSFYKQAKKRGIHPVFGLSVDLKDKGRSFEVVLYAKNDKGFSNLMKLSSHICTSDEKIIGISLLNKYKEDNFVVLMSDDMPLSYAVDMNENVEETFDYQNSLFGKDYLVALCDHDISINRNRDTKLKKLLKEKGITTFALSRTYYPDKKDEEAYRVLKCIRDKNTIHDENSSLDSGRYFMSKEEYDVLYDTDDLLNTDILSSKCRVEMNFKTTLPLYPTPADVSSKDYLVALCKEGLKRRLKDKLNKTYTQRLQYELDVITRMKFEDYFLIVYDFILFAKKKGILVGPARGSAGGSLVAYCLGITEIDPLKYGLIFERFLNPERISMPDIDTDFPDDRRDEVIEYVRDKYGKEHVAHIITFGTLKARQVLRDVARALDYKNSEVDPICKMIPNTPNMTLDLAYNTIPLFRQKIESDGRYRTLYGISRKLEFFPRHESTHAAGIVISSKPLYEVVPVISIEKDVDSTQYTMEHLEEMGLIKMDFLGLRNLGIIAEICDEINRDTSFDIKKIPLDDRKTFNLIDNVNVLGVFQLESSGMRSLIKKMKPQSFEEISMTIALFRPGPMENIPLFLKNRQNPRSIVYAHPDLKPILEETYGIIVYQEQVMNIARKMAGFSYAKADILRKAMSKKKQEELEKLHPDFVTGCKENGYDEKTAEDIYQLILKFANYGFNKSHSIGYGLVAYQMAYLKANYPLYFYKALLNGTIGSESKAYEYISECRSIGQHISGVSINNSDKYYQIDDKGIIMPLSIVKNVGSVTVDKILDERRKYGAYKDYVECVRRLVNVGVDVGAINSLINAGAFDEFGYSRYTMSDSLGNVMLYAGALKGEISILDDDDAPIIEKKTDNVMVKAEKEKEVLGFYFSFNPLIEIKKKHNIDTPDLSSIESVMGPCKGFGLINRVKKIKTKKGDPMAFADIVDDKGAMSLAIMPNVYSQCERDLVSGAYIYFEGKIERESSCLVRTVKIYREGEDDKDPNRR